jgi:ubiquitin carboxyl-terminal hydrolase 25/28
MHYGSGSRRYPLADILQYAQEFAEAGCDSSTLLSLDTDVEMDSPRPVDETKVKADSDLIGGVEASVNSDLTVPSAVGTAGLSHSVSSLMSHSSTLPRESAAAPEAGTPTPAPAFVSPQELEVLQSCLSRWRREIETNVSSKLLSYLAFLARSTPGQVAIAVIYFVFVCVSQISWEI